MNRNHAKQNKIPKRHTKTRPSQAEPNQIKTKTKQNRTKQNETNETQKNTHRHTNQNITQQHKHKTARHEMKPFQKRTILKPNHIEPKPNQNVRQPAREFHKGFGDGNRREKTKKNTHGKPMRDPSTIHAKLNGTETGGGGTTDCFS